MCVFISFSARVFETWNILLFFKLPHSRVSAVILKVFAYWIFYLPQSHFDLKMHSHSFCISFPLVHEYFGHVIIYTLSTPSLTRNKIRMELKMHVFSWHTWTFALSTHWLVNITKCLKKWNQNNFHKKLLTNKEEMGILGRVVD